MGLLQELMEDSRTRDLTSSAIRGDNLLDWTVRDQAETSIDYDLGEIANRSFRDRYGIWAGQEEIFPVWGTGEPEDSGRIGELAPGSRSRGLDVKGQSAAEGRAARGATSRAEGVDGYSEVKGDRMGGGRPPLACGSPGGITEWAASGYLRALAEERCRVSPWEEEVLALQDRDLEELEEGSEAWEGPQEERPSAMEASSGVEEGDLLNVASIYILDAIKGSKMTV